MSLLDRELSGVVMTADNIRTKRMPLLVNFGVAIDHARDLMEGRTANLGTTSGLIFFPTFSARSMTAVISRWS